LVKTWNEVAGGSQDPTASIAEAVAVLAQLDSGVEDRVIRQDEVRLSRWMDPQH